MRIRRYRLPELLAIACFAVLVQAVQVPLTSGSFEPAAFIGANADSDHWNLSLGPAEDDTGHLVFNTASSFLQHWPNTRYRNGHSIVPGTIAPGTLLYHMSFKNVIPEGPEWTATDPEHSYYFCTELSEGGEGCWQATFVATRPLKVLYFDGSSAVKLQTGTTDAQDVVIYGDVKTENFTLESELRRIITLCEGGKRFGIDGFVRMEMDFEIMLCDFTDGVELVSHLNLVIDTESSVSDLPHPSSRSPPRPNLQQRSRRGEMEVMYAGHWHNRYPGEQRITLDYFRMISFYDTDLVPSLVSVRQKQARWDHRLKGISHQDVSAVMRRLEGYLSRNYEGSGVDWETLLRVVIDRYSDRLELVQHVLDATESDTVVEALKIAQRQLRIMLTPYILLSIKPRKPEDDESYAWATPAFQHCATSHTAYIASPAFVDKLMEAEHLLLKAVQETSREICRVVTGMWAEGVLHGLDDNLRPPDSDVVGVEHEVHDLASRWKIKIDSLMDWLDWSVWIKCRPACPLEEECYLPTWPFFWRRPSHEYERPEPRCIRRLEPFPDDFP